MLPGNSRNQYWIALLLSVVFLVLARGWLSLPQTSSPDAEPVSAQAKVETSRPDFQTIETALLPLRLVVDRVSERVHMQVGGGAIEPFFNQLLIMDRVGTIFIYDGKNISSASFPALPMHDKEFLKDEQFHPSESTLRAHDILYDKEGSHLYVSFDSWDAVANAPRFVIAALTLARDSAQPIGEWRAVYTSAPVPLTDYYAGRSAGGKMLLDGRNLYFAIGDYSLDRIVSSPNDVAAQNINLPFGKIYRYNLTTGSVNIVSIGHRVPEGLAVTSSGLILETEHGPRGGDELNIIEKGVNYGWPYVSYGTRYFSYRPYLDSAQFKKETTKPAFAWVPSIGATCIFESRLFAKEWAGDIILGSLKAQSLFRIGFANGHVVFSEPIWVGYRVRDALEQDGRIIIWSDAGSLVSLTPDRELMAKDRLNVDTGYASAVLTSCSTCHSLSKHNQFNWAPTLYGVYGSAIASESFQNYSPALKRKDGVWNDGTLTAFLLDPQGFAPGTTMINPGLAPEEIAKIVRQLKESAVHTERR